MQSEPPRPPRIKRKDKQMNRFKIESVPAKIQLVARMLVELEVMHIVEFKRLEERQAAIRRCRVIRSPKAANGASPWRLRRRGASRRMKSAYGRR